MPNALRTIPAEYAFGVLLFAVCAFGGAVMVLRMGRRRTSAKKD
ncbi:MAG TPA: hypothetical protein VFQ38_15665 [Longimicrobiales bacterium]|nr:hypothetical protein [Longimicrobiales bacterium]